MPIDSPRNRKIIFLVVNFPLTLVLFYALNSLAFLVFKREPSLEVLIAIYLAITAVIDVFLLGMFRIRTLAMVFAALVEVMLIYALFLYLFLSSLGKGASV